MAAASLLAFASSPVAAAPLFSELRAEFPAIERALGNLPDGRLRSDLERVSATLQHPEVRDLEPGSSSEIPVKWERRMAAALSRLADDTPALTTLSAQDQYTLLQVISVVAFERNVELYSDLAWSPCFPGDACSGPPVLLALDGLAQRLVPVIQGLALLYEDAASGDPLLPAGPGIAPDSEYHSQSLQGWVDALQDSWGYIHGEPLIDD